MTDYRRSGETYFIAGLELSDDNPVKVTHLLTGIGYLLLSLDDRSATQAAKAEEVRDQLMAFGSVKTGVRPGDVAYLHPCHEEHAKD